MQRKHCFSEQRLFKCCFWCASTYLLSLTKHNRCMHAHTRARALWPCLGCTLITCVWCSCDVHWGVAAAAAHLIIYKHVSRSAMSELRRDVDRSVFVSTLDVVLC